MKKYLTLAVIFCTFVMCSIANAAAQVTDARWGVNAENVLRLVVDLTGSATYQIKMSDQSKLNLVVDAPANPSLFKVTPVRSTLANSMRVYEESAKTIVEVSLTKVITEKDYKSFVLKTDPRNGRPSRIVLDVTADKKAPSTTPATKTTPSTTATTVATSQPSTTQPSTNNKPVVSTKPTNKRPPIIKAPTTTQSPASTTAATPSTSTSTNTNATSTSAPKENPAKTEPQKVETPQTEEQKPAVQKVDKRKDIKVIAKENVKNKKTTTEKATTKAPVTKTENGIPAIKATKKYSVGGGLKGKTIVLDAGHGGSDPGAIGASGLREKDVTLPITKFLKKELEDKGAKVFMTRMTDVDVCKPGASDRDELQARVNVAEKNNCDAFVSIHINASSNRTVGGFSTYYHPKTQYDNKLARLIQTKLAKNFSVNDLGVREAGFYVIKRSSMPACLVELCFISNPREEKLMQSGWFRKKAAAMIADGIEEYFK